MRRNNHQFLWFMSAFLVIQLAVFSVFSSTSEAGGTIKIGDHQSVSVGMGLRTSISLTEDGAPNGTSYGKDFSLENMRFYMAGQLLENVTFEFNTEYESGTDSGTDEDIRVLDAVIKIAFNDLFNVWVGRFLPPSDRSNLDGPYYLNAWDFPFVQKYPAIFAGRDDGLAIWGQVGGGMFKYQFGAFDGIGTTPTGPNQKDSLLFAGRLTLNLLDPEPGYYNSSTYYGGKDIFAIGLVAMSQEDAVGTAAAPGDFNGWNVDLLIEKDLGGSGVATLEGAYYDYDNDGAATGEGDGFLALASYLLPNKIGSGGLAGQLQPLVRYQEFQNEGLSGTGEHSRTDFALSHIIYGHNARISLTLSMDEFSIPDLTGKNKKRPKP